MVCSNARPSEPLAPTTGGAARNPKDVSQPRQVIPFDSEQGLALTVLPVTFHPVSSPSPAPGARPPRAPQSAGGSYASFFSATLAPLQRYLARLVGSREEAQDIAQDAYAKVYEVMQRREIEYPQALLYTTARHLALDELKHRARAPFKETTAADAAPAPSPGVEALVMAREESLLLEQAVNQLPADCRQVFLLRMGEHLTHEQIGQRLGLTRKQAEKRLYLAVSLLHAAMHPPAKPSP